MLASKVTWIGAIHGLHICQEYTRQCMSPSERYGIQIAVYGNRGDPDLPDTGFRKSILRNGNPGNHFIRMRYVRFLSLNQRGQSRFRHFVLPTTNCLGIVYGCNL